jgi:hypothetical protein
MEMGKDRVVFLIGLRRKAQRPQTVEPFLLQKGPMKKTLNLVNVVLVNGEKLHFSQVETAEVEDGMLRLKFANGMRMVFASGKWRTYTQGEQTAKAQLLMEAKLHMEKEQELA